MPGLSLRRQRFIQEYLTDGNGAQAAIRAGYSSKCAREAAYQLLTSSDIREAVEAESKRLAEELRMKRQDAVLALVEAAEHARAAGNARLMIQAWREISLLLGFYPKNYSRYPVQRASVKRR